MFQSFIDWSDPGSLGPGRGQEDRRTGGRDMPLYQTRTIAGILEPVAQQVLFLLFPSPYPPFSSSFYFSFSFSSSGRKSRPCSARWRPTYFSYSAKYFQFSAKLWAVHVKFTVFYFSNVLLNFLMKTLVLNLVNWGWNCSRSFFLTVFSQFKIVRIFIFSSLKTWARK